MSLCGALLLILAESRVEGRSMFAGVPSLGENKPKTYMQLTGRILVVFMFVTVLHLDFHPFIILQNIVAIVLMAAVTVGYKAKLSALVLVLWLSCKLILRFLDFMNSNLNFPFQYSTFTQTLSGPSIHTARCMISWSMTFSKPSPSSVVCWWLFYSDLVVYRLTITRRTGETCSFPSGNKQTFYLVLYYHPHSLCHPNHTQRHFRNPKKILKLSPIFKVGPLFLYFSYFNTFSTHTHTHPLTLHLAFKQSLSSFLSFLLFVLLVGLLIYSFPIFIIYFTFVILYYIFHHFERIARRCAFINQSNNIHTYRYNGIYHCAVSIDTKFSVILTFRFYKYKSTCPKYMWTLCSLYPNSHSSLPNDTQTYLM